MAAKSRRILMAFVGAYLTYIGGQLVKDSIAGSPKYETLLIICGGVFVLFGLATVFVNVKAYIRESRMEQEALAQEAAEAEEAVETSVEALRTEEIAEEDTEETVDSSEVIDEDEE